MKNSDERTVEGFGDEWSRFDQSALDAREAESVFAAYFRIFPWASLPANAVGFDLGSGSGRWAKMVAPRVGKLHCIDASSRALEVAKRNLCGASNCEFHLASVEEIPLGDATMDFGYSLGVLHHIPDTAKGIKSCVSKLRPGAPFLLYLYYAFDNRPGWFRTIWRASDVGRRLVSRLPMSLRYGVSQGVAFTVYLPLARTAALLERAGFDVGTVPLSSYRHRSFYTMRTDALDRFGTRVEHRFTAQEIRELMEQAGLTDIVIGDEPPYWCAMGRRGAVP
jgi:SAM-dependent methyltransferase